MKNWLRKTVCAVFILIFLLAIGQVIYLVLDQRNAAQANAQAQSVACAVPTTTAAPVSGTSAPETTEALQPTDENIPYLQQLDIQALRQINPDVIGWIYIPGTKVDYPLLHAKDNDTYLRRTWDGQKNTAGSIFLETKCGPDLNNFNTIIYGHNMRNGTMFADLKRYSDSEYYGSHPYVYIVTQDTVYRYEVFSAYETGVKTDTFRVRFTNEEKKRALRHYIESAVWDGELTPALDDLILTLSTCTGTGGYDTRWVVQALRSGQWDK